MKVGDLVAAYLRSMADYSTKCYGEWELICSGLLIDYIVNTGLDTNMMHILTASGDIRWVNHTKRKKGSQLLQFKVEVINESG